MTEKNAKYTVKRPENARDVALFALLNINNTGKKANVFLRETLDRNQSLEIRDKALCEHIVSATLDHLYSIDEILGAYSNTPVSRLNPYIREILRMSVCQLLYMDRIPQAACINEAVELARGHGLSGLSGYVNGVLRSIARDKETKTENTRFHRVMNDGAVRWSVPRWLYVKMTEDFGIGGAEKLFESWMVLRKTSVRFNCSKGLSEEEILRMITDDGVSAERIEDQPPVYELEGLSGIGVASLKSFREGYITVQDPSAALLVRYAAPEMNSLVVDLCAAPGGKSLAYADAMKGTGTVLARDISKAKTDLIEENIRRCGFQNITVSVSDAAVKDRDLIGRADLVIADTPCSGLGVVAKKPDIKKNLTPESIMELRDLQRKILENAVQYVKTGGRLVYSTCTVTKEENEGNFYWACSSLPVKPVTMQRIQPDLHHDGFFIAVFEKTG